MEVDKGTTFCQNLQWARVLIKIDGIKVLRSLQVVMGQLCCAIQLLWEILPSSS